MSNERSKAEKIRDSYDLTASYYDSRYKEIQFSKYRVLKELTWRNDASILDAGCGTGLLFEFLPESVLRVGLDLSMNMLRNALEKQSSRGKAEFVAGSLDALPFREGAFMVVLSFTAVQNLGNPRRGIRECSRVLGPEGESVITCLRKSVSLDSLVTWCEEYSLQALDEWGFLLEDVGVWCQKTRT